jgi:hypothetical protein
VRNGIPGRQHHCGTSIPNGWTDLPGKDTHGGKHRQNAYPTRRIEARLELRVLGWKLEQTPVEIGKTAEKAPDFEMILGHQADLWNHFFADVSGPGDLADFEGQVETALGGGFVERALKEAIKGLGYLAFDLITPENERIVLSAHISTYIYARIAEKVNQKSENK